MHGIRRSDNHGRLVGEGMARARSQGKPLGRPRISDERRRAIIKLHREGVGIHTIARRLGAGTGVVQRVLKELKAGEE